MRLLSSSLRLSSRLSSCHIHRHASGHVFGHVLCQVRHDDSLVPSLIITFITSHHVSRGALHHSSVTSPILSFVVFLMSVATTLLAFLSSHVFCHDFAISKCAAHHSESDSTPAKFHCAISKCCTAPQRDQNTSKRRPLKRESQWICNANVTLHKTLRRTTSDTLRATILAQWHEK